MPSIINKHKEVESVTKVKKEYSVLSQALLFAINENGTVDQWDIGNNGECSEKLVNYIKPYLNISKDCKCESGCISSNYKYLNNTNNNSGYNTSSWHYKMFLNDGTAIWIRDYKTSGCSAQDGNGEEKLCGLILIDINGTKTPNKFGVDVFAFFIKNDRIIPHTTDDCEITKPGWGCAKYILTNNNMKYYYK